MSLENSRLSVREWSERILLRLLFNKYHAFDSVKLEVKDFETDGLVLDIGGGGEGVIGRLKGKQVVAIDIRKDELEEMKLDAPLKIVMDAREMTFLDGSFTAATAFFSLMYMKTREDHQKVMREAWRVLEPGGRLRLWEVDLPERSEAGKDFYLVRLRYRVVGFEKGTAYGRPWPKGARGEAYYLQLAGEAGFHHLTTERLKHVLYFEFIKK